MLELYFGSRATARLRSGPDAAWLASFLTMLQRQGYARLSIQLYLRQAELLGQWLRQQQRPLASLTDADVGAFATRSPSQRLQCNARSAGNHLLGHLRECGLVPPSPPRAPMHIEQVITAFDSHLQNVAGLAYQTRLYRRRYVREFLLAVFGSAPLRWTQVRTEHVRDFVSGYGQTGRTAAAQVAAVSLRSFFRWLQFRGLIKPQLLAAVPQFRRWRLATLPPVLTDDQLTALLATFDRTTAVGRRDYAMILCMVDLGLRVAEVAVLELSHVDKTKRTLELRSGKSLRERVLPMTQRVSQAVCNYLQNDRPPTSERYLFVRHRLPLGTRVSRELIRGVLRRAFAKVPGCEALTGTHILRHTAASRLLRAGADLKRIADILGHRSLDTTASYTKIDAERLATVAQPWPSTDEVPS